MFRHSDKHFIMIRKDKIMLMKEENFNLKCIRPISINERSKEFDLILRHKNRFNPMCKRNNLSLSKTHTDCFSLAYVLHLPKKKSQTTVDRINTD